MLALPPHGEDEDKDEGVARSSRVLSSLVALDFVRAGANAAPGPVRDPAYVRGLVDTALVDAAVSTDAVDLGRACVAAANRVRLVIAALDRVPAELAVSEAIPCAATAADAIVTAMQMSSISHSSIGASNDRAPWSTAAAAAVISSAAVDLLHRAWSIHSKQGVDAGGSNSKSATSTTFVLQSRGFNSRQSTALLLGALSMLSASDWEREARIAQMLGQGRVLFSCLERASRGGRMRDRITASGRSTSSKTVWPAGVGEWLALDTFSPSSHGN